MCVITYNVLQHHIIVCYNAQALFFNKGSMNKNNINKNIAHTLKCIRKKNGWSLDTASEKTGVSKAMLGQIERAESTPTVATLWKIATGFNVSFSSFIKNNEPILTKKQENETQTLIDENIKIKTIFPYDDNLKFETFLIELKPHCEQMSHAHQKNSVEHIIVAEGVVDILIDNMWHTVNTHEGIKFKADQKHGYRNTTENSAIFYNIIHYNFKK